MSQFGYKWLILCVCIQYSTSDLSYDTFQEQDSRFAEEYVFCPEIGRQLYGDLRFHSGCYLDEQSGPHRSKSLLAHPQNKMQTRFMHRLNQLSSQLLNATSEANEVQMTGRSAIDENIEGSCGSTCVPVPVCCQVDTMLQFPLFAYSLTSETFVQVVQETDGILQPVIYRKCRTTKTNVVRGRCLQSSLPRLLHVYSKETAGRMNPYFQDLVSLPSNCECIVSLSSDSPLTGDQSTTTIAPAQSTTKLQEDDGLLVTSEKHDFVEKAATNAATQTADWYHSENISYSSTSVLNNPTTHIMNDSSPFLLMTTQSANVWNELNETGGNLNNSSLTTVLMMALTNESLPDAASTHRPTTQVKTSFELTATIKHDLLTANSDVGQVTPEMSVSVDTPTTATEPIVLATIGRPKNKNSLQSLGRFDRNMKLSPIK